LHALNAKDVDFSTLIQQLIQKEKMLLSLRELKYTSNTFAKDNKKPYTKKEEKPIHMVDRPKSSPKIQ